MLIRIVKMKFRQDCISDFQAHFEAHKELIRNFEGCHYLKVLQQKDDATVWMTYSHWDNEAALNKYRDSELFGAVWKQTKLWFADKPQAWSFDQRYELI